MGQMINKVCNCGTRQRDSVASLDMENSSFIKQYEKDGEDDYQKSLMSSPSPRKKKEQLIHNSYCINSVSINDFNQIKVLGRGSFGKVILVQSKQTNEYFAMKILKKKDIILKDQIQNALREKQILQSNINPYVVKLKFAFQDQYNIFMIMEYMQGGELFHHLKKRKKFREKTVIYYTAQIILALEYLHQDMKIIYRDLKPENILLDVDGNIKLTDFGLAAKKEQDAYSFCGTPEFLAPEIINQDSYGIEIDIWTLGCCIYEMLVGQPPFRAKQRKELYKLILKNQPNYPNELSANAKDLIQNLLKTDPSKRLKIWQIKQHNFFKDVNWNDMLQKKYQAPINLNLKNTNPVDTRYFDEFKCQIQPTPPQSKLSISNNMHFEDFTYQGEQLQEIIEEEDQIENDEQYNNQKQNESKTKIN